MNEMLDVCMLQAVTISNAYDVSDGNFNHGSGKSGVRCITTVRSAL
jgi:hypothetical protein